MCLSKEKGGLGVKCLSNLNKALLCKWNWHFANERETLWNQVIRGKYGKKEGMELSGSEKGAWCGALKRNKDGLGFCGL